MPREAIKDLPRIELGSTVEAVVDYLGRLHTSLMEMQYSAPEYEHIATTNYELDDFKNTSLADPDADRIVFWDDSAGLFTFLTAGTGLAISTTNLSLSHLGLESLTDPGADRIFFWDDGGTASGWLVPDGTTIQISGTTLSAIAGGIDHGGLAGLGDDDHTQYLLADGTRNLGGTLTVDAGADQSIIIKGTSTGNANIGWIGFYDSDGTTRRGHIGDGSVNDDDIYIGADTGYLRLTAGGYISLGTHTYFPDDVVMSFGASLDYSIGYAQATDTLQIVNGTTLGSNVRLKLDSSGHFDFGAGNLTTTGTLGCGVLTSGNIIIPDAGNIGSASDTDAIAIAAGGEVTLSQTLILSDVVNASADTDKFLVLDGSGNVDFRTGAEVLSDIGAGGGGGAAVNPYAFRRIGRAYTTWDYFTSTTQAAVREKLYAYPFIVPTSQDFDRIIVAVSTGQVNGVARVGIYDDTGDNYPDNLVVDSGEIDCSAAAYKSTVITETLTAGLYWLVIISDGDANITFRAMDYNQSSPIGYFAIFGNDEANFTTVPPTHLSLADTYGALPDPFPGSASMVNSENLIAIMLRKA